MSSKKRYSVRRFPTGALVLILALIVACSGEPVPEDKQAYLGLWRGEGVTLEIHAHGYVNYRKTRGVGATRINAPIVAYEGDDFFTEVFFVKNRFKVSKPPFQEDGRWWMVVDGARLKKLE